MGLRVRLKASFDTRGFPRQARDRARGAEALRDDRRRQRLELVHLAARPTRAGRTTTCTRSAASRAPTSRSSTRRRCARARRAWPGRTVAAWQQGRGQALYFTGDEEADRLLAEEPLALLIGFALDQQVPVPRAFSAPLELQRRLGTLDAGADRRAWIRPSSSVFREKPALHRFPGAMAERVQELCRGRREDYDGDAARIWHDAADGDRPRAAARARCPASAR